MSTVSTEKFWQDFLKEKNLPPETKYTEAFYFGSNEISAESLLKLVLEGKKTATSSSVLSYEISGEEPPKAGDYSIVTNWAGVPFCVIETKATQIIKFNEMTFDICKREGEDDCLESWQNNHRYYFSFEGKELGYAFSEDMKIIFEDFEVVYKIGSV
jgi:uncharacterized protein YhfF